MAGKVIGGMIATLVLGLLFVVSWLMIFGVYKVPAGTGRTAMLTNLVMYAAGPILLIAGIWWLVAALRRRD